MSVQQYVNLHLHTQYSLLDGFCRIDKLFPLVKEFNQPAVAITDHGNTYGLIEAYNTSKQHGVKAILGSEFYCLCETSRHERSNTDLGHMIILAKNEVGYKNILKMTTVANREGFYYRPRIDHETLLSHKEGIIITSACIASNINRYFLSGHEDKAVELIKFYKEAFGDDFYLEVQSHKELEKQNRVNRFLIAQGKKLGIKIIATNDSHYLTPGDAKYQDVAMCIGLKKMLADSNRLTMMDSITYYVRSNEEMSSIFRGYEDFLKNTLEVAEKCNVEIETGKLHFPNFKTPHGEDQKVYFRQMVQERLNQKFNGNVPENYQKRADYEMDVICDKGYANYFLITQDFVNWAKNNGIKMGPGRGSCGGSLVAYILGITIIDPIENNLVFERFLNPYRPGSPDVDLDASDAERDRLIKYVEDTYGADHVAHMVTFGKMEARTAIRDVARVMGIEYGLADTISKTVPEPAQGKHIKLKDCVETEPKLSEYYHNPQYKQLFEYAMAIEGMPRHTGVHASAIIVSDNPLDDYVSIAIDKKTGLAITEANMYVLDTNVSPDEAIGLLKFDFLGLRTLTTIQKALELIQQNRGITLDIDGMERNDEKTFELLRSGNTTGCFQLDSAGMKGTLKGVAPTCFSDIAAVLALYRPGPMDMIPVFIQGKKDPSSVHYLHPDLKPILGSTYGVLVYQEQILQIANVMGGYSLGEADILRRAIGKKKKELLDANRDRFIKQSVERGYPEATAKEVWDYIEKFAAYGFNCVSGSTKFYRNRNGSKYVPTVEEMYEIKNNPRGELARAHESLSEKYRREGYGSCWSLDGDRLKINKIVDIRFAGIRQTYKITLESGKTISVTDNHKFPTPQGEKHTDELSVGDWLYVNRGHQKTTSLERKKYFLISGYRVFTDFVEEHLGLPCEICGKINHNEAHHIDGDHFHNDLENLQWVCNSCHKKLHYQMGRVKYGQRGLLVGQERIVSIELDKIEKVYDVEVSGDVSHTFLTDGEIVTSNSSHAVGYAVISYQTAYLKAHYPIEYMTAIMSTESSSNSAKREERIMEIIDECKAMGIKVLNPDLNYSQADFSIEPDKDSLDGKAIRVGLTAIKGLGIEAITNILENRQRNGKATSFTQFVIDADKRKVNKKVLIALIKSGAMDSVNPNRNQLLQNVETVLASLKKYAKLANQESLFGNAEFFKDDFAPVEDFSDSEKYKLEKEAFGYYLSGSPFADALAYIEERADLHLGDIKEEHLDQDLHFGAMIDRVREVKTKKGLPMAFITLKDKTGSVDAVVFPDLFARSREALKPENVVYVLAKVQQRGGDFNLLINTLDLVPTKLTEADSKAVYMDWTIDRPTLAKLKNIIATNPGRSKVTFYFTPKSGETRSKPSLTKVSWNKQVVEKIRSLGLKCTDA